MFSMRSRTTSLQEYKAIKIREFLRTYLSTPRYEQMRRQLTSLKQAADWSKYRSRQQEQRIIKVFSQIESLKEIDKLDKPLVQLQQLMHKKSFLVQALFNLIPYENLIVLIFQKKGEVTLKDIQALKYTKTETINKIYEKIIQSSQFEEWKRKHFAHESNDMQIEPTPRANNEWSIYSAGENQLKTFKKKQSLLQKDQQQNIDPQKQRNKITEWIGKIYQANENSSQDILQVQLLNGMIKLLTTAEKIKLNTIKDIIQAQSRWNGRLQEYFKSEMKGEQHTVFSLSGVFGYKKLKQLLQIVLPINIFQLEERSQLSKLEQFVQNGLFIVGNTGVGKTTFIQSLLGYQHVKQRVNLKTNLIIDGDLRKEHRRLEAGDSSTSITTYLTSVPFTYKNKQIKLIDTPGFQDTRGALTDIANQIMLERAYDKCGNTAYIILSDVKKLQVNRYYGIKALALQIAQRFEYSSLEQLQQYVLLLFNNKFNLMSSNEIHNLRVQSQSLQRNSQFIDGKNKIAFQFIVQSIRSNQHFFDPFSLQSKDGISSLISNLKFSKKNKLSTHFQSHTKVAVIQMVKIIKKHLQSTTPISKKWFYYDLLYKMNSFVPNLLKKVKDELDEIIQLYVNNLFEEITRFLQQRLRLINYHQDSFIKFLKNNEQFSQSQILARINTSLKSHKDLQQQFELFSQKLFAKIKQSQKFEDLNSIFQFIKRLQAFERYFPQLKTKIELFCSAQLKKLQLGLEQAFQDGDQQIYQCSILKYQMYENICKFLQPHFKQLQGSKFKQKTQIIDLYSKFLKENNTKIRENVSLILNWLNDKTGNLKVQIEQLNATFAVHIKYEKFTMLYQAEQRQQLKNQIVKQFSKCLINICQDFDLFISFPLGFHKEIQKHNGRIKKLYWLNENSTVQILNREINAKLKSIEQAYNSKSIAFAKTLQQINNSLEQNIKFVGEANFEMKQRLQVFQAFKYLKPEQIYNLQALHDKFQKKLTFISYQLVSKIEEMQPQKLKQAEYIKLIQSIKVFYTYSKLKSNDCQAHKDIMKNLQNSISDYIQKIAEINNKKKFQNFQDLAQKFSNKHLQSIRNCIYNFLNPTATIAKFMPSITEGLISVFQSIRRIFEKLEQFVNDRKTFIPAQEKLRLKDFKLLSANHAKCLRYIYDLVKKYVNPDRIIIQYLLDPIQNVSISEGSFSPLQIEKAIEENYVMKIKQLRQQINNTSLTQSNLPIFNILKAQCFFWRELEDLIRKENPALYKQSLDHFSQFIDILLNKIAKIQQRQLTKIQSIIDIENHKILNIQQVGKAYNQLRNNMKAQISPASEQNFQLFMERLKTYIYFHSKETKVKLIYENYNEISSELIIFLEEQIELYGVLRSSITQHDIKEYNITFIEDVKKMIENIIKKIDNFWSSSISAVQKVIEERDFSKANKMILILQTQKQLVEKFQSLHSHECKQSQPNLNNTNFNLDIKKLRQTLQIQQKKREHYLENPFLNEDIANKLVYLYKSQSTANKLKLKKKMRQYFIAQLDKFKALPKDASSKVYNDLMEFLERLPEGIAKDYDWYNQLQAQNKKKEDQELRQLTAIVNARIDTQSSRKQLFSKFLTTKNVKFRIQIIKKIKQIFRQRKTVIQESKILKQKIEQFSQINSIYSCSQYEQLRKQISSTIQDFENDQFQHFQGQAGGYFEKVQNRLKKTALAIKQSQAIQISQRIDNGFLLYKFSRRLQQQKRSSIVNIILLFNRFITFLIESFAVICPLNDVLSKLDENAVILSTIRQLSFKINIYQKVIQLLKGVKLQQRTVQARIICEENINIQYGSIESLSSIQVQIKQFRDKLEQRTTQIKRYLMQFKFDDESLYHCENKLKIKQKVQELKRNLELGISSELLKQIDIKYVLQSSFIEEQKLLYNKQLNKFVKNVLDQYKLFLENDPQTPSAFEYLQYLSQQISLESYMSFLSFNYEYLLEHVYNPKKHPTINEFKTDLVRFIKHYFEGYITKLKQFKLHIISSMTRCQKSYSDKQIKLWKQQSLKKAQNQRKTKLKTLKYLSIDQQDNQQQQQYNIEADYNRQKQQIQRKYRQQMQKLEKQKYGQVEGNLTHYFELLVSLVKIKQTFLGKQILPTFENAIKEAQDLIRTNNLEASLQKYVTNSKNKNRYVSKLIKYLQLLTFLKAKQLNEKNTSQLCEELVCRISKKSGSYSQFDFLKEETGIFIECMNNVKYSFAKKNKKMKDLVKQLHSAKNDRIMVLASIAAAWSTQKQLNSQKSQINCQPSPHLVQIIALLLLTKSNNQQENFTSSLAEMKIGEGKTLVLAILATYYAIKGYKVSVACYSSLLSKIAQESCNFLFQAFEVSQKIFYGSFYQVCQNTLVIQNTSLREAVKQSLLRNQSKSLSGILSKSKNWFFEKTSKFIQKIGIKNAQKKSVLLFDEIDMLFEREYLQLNLKPILKLKNDSIMKLLKKVWSQVSSKQNVQPKQVMQLEEYRYIVQSYPKLKEFIHHHINRMLTIAYKAPIFQYQVSQNGLCYENQERCSIPLNYGYQTVFSYLRQYDAKKIKLSACENELALLIRLGQFTYYQILKTFSVIKGLSGTLSILQPNKQLLLNESYNISSENMYMIPSLYLHNSQMRTEYFLCNNESYFKNVCDCLEKLAKCPVVVCFQNYKQLKQFEESQLFTSLRLKYNALHYLKNDQNKRKIISEAGEINALTLITAEFARGINIEVNSITISQGGCLHLVLAYIPDSSAQFQQFKGRSGRLGQLGSMDFVFNVDLFKKKLKRLNYNMNIPSETCEIEDCWKEYCRFYDYLSMPLKLNKLKQHKQNNSKTLALLQGKQYMQYIYKSNEYPAFTPRKYKIVIALNGMKSMQGFFSLLQANLKQVFQNINKLKSQMSNKYEFSIQLIVYYNYSHLQFVTMRSQFETHPQKLCTFLKGIEPIGNEESAALEVLYRMVNRLDIDMLFVIGDTRANNKMEIREALDSKSWKTYAENQMGCQDEQFYNMNTFQDQIKKLPNKLIINGLSIQDQRAKSKLKDQFYTQIKQLSELFKGESKQINMSHKNADEQTIKFLTTNITSLLNPQRSKQEIQKLYEKISGSKNMN